jgi:hypothetical protein
MLLLQMVNSLNTPQPIAPHVFDADDEADPDISNTSHHDHNCNDDQNCCYPEHSSSTGAHQFILSQSKSHSSSLPGRTETNSQTLPLAPFIFSPRVTSSFTTSALLPTGEIKLPPTLYKDDDDDAGGGGSVGGSIDSQNKIMVPPASPKIHEIYSSSSTSQFSAYSPIVTNVLLTVKGSSRKCYMPTAATSCETSPCSSGTCSAPTKSTTSPATKVSCTTTESVTDTNNEITNINPPKCMTIVITNDSEKNDHDMEVVTMPSSDGAFTPKTNNHTSNSDDSQNDLKRRDSETTNQKGSFPMLSDGDDVDGSGIAEHVGNEKNTFNRPSPMLSDGDDVGGSGIAEHVGNEKSTFNRPPPMLVSNPPAISPLQKKSQHLTCTQIVREEIDCGNGMIFQNFDDIPDNHFLYVPGVRMRKMKAKPKPTQRRCGNKRKLSMDGNDESQSKVFYSGRMSLAGVSVNLGSDHRSSAAAAAALDIANKLYWGRNNRRPYYVLSEVEVLQSLGSVGYGSTIHPQEFVRSLFTQERKEYFESLVDEALSSLGGRDDYYADILCSLDSSSSADGNKGLKVKATKNVKEKANCQESIDETLSYSGKHIMFEVDNDGMFTWKLDDSVKTMTSTNV